MKSHELLKQGGEWLAAARKWIQRKKINGDTVKWGSGTVLKPDMTVREVEEVASEVAAAALKEFGVLLDWRDEWPDEAGYWLFWGYQKPNGRQFLMLMDAQHDSNGALSFIGEGSFWYKEEDLLRGKFAKASGIPLPA